jgi:hypothetical protein
VDYKGSHNSVAIRLRFEIGVEGLCLDTPIPMLEIYKYHYETVINSVLL